MSILSDFEDRIGRAVEGMFAGVFRSPVQPAELARACAKEMDKRRKLGVGKVYAPTMYSVLLSPEDADQLGGFADTLAGELETYLVGHAREKSYDLSTRPRVRFLVDDDLKLGRFDVIGELRSAEEIAAEIGDEDEYFEPDAVAGASVPSATVFDVERHEEATAGRGIATVTVRGIDHDVALIHDRMVIGRLRSCDICLPDQNVSRQHATLERDGEQWYLADLGSTNGTYLNGERVERQPLHDGDVIDIGATELVFNEARP